MGFVKKLIQVTIYSIVKNIYFIFLSIITAKLLVEECNSFVYLAFC